MIAIVDYGLGNLGSIVNMLKKLGHASEIVHTPAHLTSQSGIILPGVGAFDTGMKNLVEKGWVDVLNNKVFEKKTPVLGICLGMQLMTKGSEEGKLDGLGWVEAQTIKFKSSNPRFKIPHMGWNVVNPAKSSALLKGFEQFTDPRFYFVHSYYVENHNQSHTLLTTNYGHEFTSGFEFDNIAGVQFHPEKSHKYGLMLLKNFGEICSYVES